MVGFQWGLGGSLYVVFLMHLSKPLKLCEVLSKKCAHENIRITYLAGVFGIVIGHGSKGTKMAYIPVKHALGHI